jgi:NADH/NAD ratio-sensing transcriptional regulator Rex
MDKFLDTSYHPKQTEEDINHLNRTISHNEIEIVIKTLPKNKVQDLTNSLLNSTRPLEKN